MIPSIPPTASTSQLTLRIHVSDGPNSIWSVFMSLLLMFVHLLFLFQGASRGGSRKSLNLRLFLDSRIRDRTSAVFASQMDYGFWGFEYRQSAVWSSQPT